MAQGEESPNHHQGGTTTLNVRKLIGNMVLHEESPKHHEGGTTMFTTCLKGEKVLGNMAQRVE